MSLNLEFIMKNGQVITFDSQVGSAANSPDLTGVFTNLDCSNMHEEGIMMDQYALFQGGEFVALTNSILLMEAGDVSGIYKVIQNNRDFMLTGEDGRLLNPAETQILLDSMGLEEEEVEVAMAEARSERLLERYEEEKWRS